MARQYSRASSQYSTVASAVVSAMPFTVSARFYPTTLAAASGEFYSIVTIAAAGENAMLIVGEDASAFKIRAQVSPSTAPTATGFPWSTNTLTVNTWHHCALTASTTNRDVWLNGTKTGNTEVIGNFSTLAETTVGGFKAGATNVHNISGRVAEVGIWDVVLTDDELLALSKGVSPLLIRPTSLKAYWPMLDSAAPDVDRWNAGYNLTPVNSPTMADHPLVFYPAGPRPPANLNGYSLAADIGAYALTGVAATLRRTLRLAAAIGSYVVSGTAPILRAAWKATTVVGSYAITGVAAALLKGRALAVSAGSYAITGVAVTLSRTRRLLTTVGAYVVTGVVAALRKARGTSVTVVISGTDYTPLIDMTTVKKEESNDLLMSNTASFEYYGPTPPTELQEITITRGISAKEFAGTVLGVKQFYGGIRHNIGWRITCQDFTWLFNDSRYSFKWAGAVSATTIAKAIVAFKAGFTSTNVEASLATVTDFEIINMTRGEALKKLADQVGAVTLKVDYDLDVHFRVTPTVINLPTDITDVTRSGDELMRESNSNQIRNRQRGLGVRVRIPFYVPAGSTAVPVDSVDRLPASGELQVGSRLLTFGAQSQAQSVAGVAGTLAAPTVALASTPAGGVLGAVRYSITAVTPDGETPLGTQSSQVTGATLAAPGAGTAAVAHTGSGGGPASGDYYTATSVSATRSGTKVSFSMSGAVVGARVYIYASTTGIWNGFHTLTEVSGSTCTFDGVSSSGPGSDTINVQLVTAATLIGTYSYKLGWLSPRGISALSPAFTASPATPSTTLSVSSFVGGAGGALTTASNYAYWYALLMDGGLEGPLVSITSTSTGANTKLTLTGINFTNQADLRMQGVRIYRSTAGGAIPRLLLEWSRANLSTLTAGWTGSFNYDDVTADTSLGTLPASTIFGGAIGISGLPAWSDGRVTGLAVLRTEAGGSTYYLHSTINSGSVSSFLDTMPDAELVQQSPVPTTSFGGHCVDLSNIPTATGATARNIYRLLNGVWRYCGTIPDNTTTTFQDDKDDDELGEPFKVGGFLTGISATGTDIAAGEIGRLHVVRNDTVAQAAALLAIGRGDGIIEGPVIDDDDLEQTPLQTACDTAIATFKASLRSVTFRSRDVLLAPGVTITFNLGSPTNIVGTFVIQKVSTSDLDTADNLNPMRKVTAGPVLSTLRKTLAA
jgi:hypothetical protein